jgi:hypothetical protein
LNSGPILALSDDTRLCSSGPGAERERERLVRSLGSRRPDLFGHPDAYRLFTGYAAELEGAGLAGRFPADAELRNIVIELLAERYPVAAVAQEPDLIDNATVEARQILDERRAGS